MIIYKRKTIWPELWRKHDGFGVSFEGCENHPDERENHEEGAEDEEEVNRCFSKDFTPVDFSA